MTSNRFDKYLKKPIEKSNQLFHERQSKYACVDDILAVPELHRSQAPTTSSDDVIDLDDDAMEVIKRFERKTLLPLPSDAQKLNNFSTKPPSPDISNVIGIKKKKKRKLEKAIPDPRPLKSFNFYQPANDINQTYRNHQPQAKIKAEARSTEKSLYKSSTMNKQNAVRNIKRESGNSASHAGSSTGDKTVLPSLTSPNRCISDSNVAKISQAKPTNETPPLVRRSIKTETIDDEEPLSSNLLLPTLSAPEDNRPAIQTSAEEMEKLRVLYDICGRELSITSELNTTQKEAGELQKKLNTIRAKERQLKEDLAEIVKQKTEIVKGCSINDAGRTNGRSSNVGS
ncbi:hypothetical protein DdX_08058 [Ditylenchus destructor]|uniref:Uncharacterized protein n=1 Tax=Ditylenchus destructor TaxID=166010 RepID=A0AAD4N5R0_9BILA|nr:hypothetical protein DdX_08058 [Ditylenchus destructor]